MFRFVPFLTHRQFTGGTKVPFLLEWLSIDRRRSSRTVICVELDPHPVRRLTCWSAAHLLATLAPPSPSAMGLLGGVLALQVIKPCEQPSIEH
jgi:hypothetical protein